MHVFKLQPEDTAARMYIQTEEGYAPIIGRSGLLSVLDVDSGLVLVRGIVPERLVTLAQAGSQPIPNRKVRNALQEVVDTFETYRLDTPELAAINQRLKEF